MACCQILCYFTLRIKLLHLRRKQYKVIWENNNLSLTLFSLETHKCMEKLKQEHRKHGFWASQVPQLLLQISYSDETKRILIECGHVQQIYLLIIKCYTCQDRTLISQQRGYWIHGCGPVVCPPFATFSCKLKRALINLFESGYCSNLFNLCLNLPKNQNTRNARSICAFRQWVSFSKQFIVLIFSKRDTPIVFSMSTLLYEISA